jgi:hypothetical protein
MPDAAERPRNWESNWPSRDHQGDGWPDAPSGPRPRAASLDASQHLPMRAETAPTAALRRADAGRGGMPVAAEPAETTGPLDHDHRSRHGRAGRQDQREPQPDDQGQSARNAARQPRAKAPRELRADRRPQTPPAGVRSRVAPTTPVLAAAGPAAPARSVATVEARPTSVAGRSARSAGAKPKRRRRSARRVAVVAGVGIVCVAAAGVGAKLLMGNGEAHTVSAPSQLGQFVDEPQLATKMDVGTLVKAIKASGEASNVVDAVYAEKTGAALSSSSVIFLFVGGNLSGSAGSFIASVTSAVPGAFVTSAGSMPGQAACIPGQAGHNSECVWADNDTFGVVASPSLNTTALAVEIRAIRPLVEHAKS